MKPKRPQAKYAGEYGPICLYKMAPAEGPIIHAIVNEELSLCEKRGIIRTSRKNLK